MYFLYMIKNADNKLYIGVSKNPEQRIAYHNESRGASYTKNQKPFLIVFLEKYETLESARKREIQIKNWRREKKDRLISKYKKGLPIIT